MQRRQEGLFITDAAERIETVHEAHALLWWLDDRTEVRLGRLALGAAMGRLAHRALVSARS
jgi:hypothetical protein